MDLETYFDIERQCKEYDEIVLKNAIGTFYNRDIFYSFNKVVKSMQRKNHLLKEFWAFDEKLKVLPCINQEILKLHVKDKKPFIEIAKTMNISLRTTQRKFANSISFLKGKD